MATNRPGSLHKSTAFVSKIGGFLVNRICNRFYQIDPSVKVLGHEITLQSLSVHSNEFGWNFKW